MIDTLPEIGVHNVSETIHSFLYSDINTNQVRSIDTIYNNLVSIL